MSGLQEQVVKKVAGLSEADLLFINDMIDRFMKPEYEDDMETKRIGIAKGKVLYNPDYDFDELNDEIAKMFGVS